MKPLPSRDTSMASLMPSRILRASMHARYASTIGATFESAVAVKLSIQLAFRRHRRFIQEGAAVGAGTNIEAAEPGNVINWDCE